MMLNWWKRRHNPSWLQTQRTFRLGFWAAATPDAYARVGDDMVCVETKTRRNKDGWGDPGSADIPDDEFCQALWQLACAPKARRVYVVVLFGFFERAEYVVERAEFTSEIENLVWFCRKFYDTLQADTPPELDSHTATLATVRALNPEIERGLEVAIPDDLAEAYDHARDAKANAESELRLATARILDLAGNAQTITDTQGRRVATRRAKGTGRPYLAPA
jgi:hypothetical protein